MTRNAREEGRMPTPFIPLQKMKERAELAREDSDTSFFFDLMYSGELTLKFMIIEVIAGLEKTTERHRYQFEYDLVRADSVGKWQSSLDEALKGPASQSFRIESRDSVEAWTSKTGRGSSSWQRESIELLLEVCSNLDVTHQVDTNSKLALQDWAQLFVSLRNRTRGHGATRSASLFEASTKLEQSLSLIHDNSPAFGRSWAYLKRGLSGKYRVSAFGGNRSDFAYLTTETTHKLTDGVYIHLQKPVRTSLVHTDVDLSDFFVPNGNYRNGKMEFISYISDLRSELIDEKFTLPVEARRESETSARPEMEVIGECFSNVPPRPTSYIDRLELEQQLSQIIGDSRNPVITLKGRGGVGKTSLALQVLHTVASEPNFFAIVWFSARDIDLLPQGAKVVRPDVLSINDVADQFSRLIQPEIRMKRSEAREYLAKCLSGESSDGPFLFVFDNFETIREPEELYEFVNTAVRLPNKVLITTRTTNFKSDYPIEIDGMNREEYGQLVAECAAKLDIEHLLSESYENEIYEESNGHPYITKVLLGEVAASGRRANLRRVIASQDNLLNSLFERSYTNLTAAGQRIFLILCSWRSAIPRLGLEAVVLRPKNERIDVRAAIEELRKSSLIETLPNDPEENFLSVPQSAAVFGKKKLITSSHREAIDADLEIIRAFGSTGATEVTGGLQPRVRKFATYIAQFDRNDEVTIQGLSVLEFIANDHSPAWLILSEFHEENGNLHESINCLRRYLQENADDRSSWIRLIRLFNENGEVRDGLGASIKLAENTKEIDDVSAAMNALNRILTNREIDIDSDERLLMVGKLRKIIEPQIQKSNATDLSRLAWLCLRTHDVSAARKYTMMGLESDPENIHCLKLQNKLQSENSP
ncbi:NB-ARC domain-containing protein [Rhodococcus erythropolis]|uniref:tetratricopeptide repeat protein n=1 Tax=Rhodococcus erythropolis TaxID=1833 RepID=UPI003A4E58CD